MNLKALWNLYRNREGLRRAIRQQLTARPKGRGNKAWKRAEALDANALHIAGNIYVQ